MLISEPQVLNPSAGFILDVVSNGFKPKEITTGIYEVGHFGCSNFLDGYIDSPALEGDNNAYFDNYGVCDNYQQVLDQRPTLADPEREFVITVKRLLKSEQSPEGGWRLHKWGEYIGIQKSQCEYLYDEPVIEEVFVYHIYEKAT